MACKITFLALLTIFTVVFVASDDKFAKNTEPCSSDVYNGLELCCGMPKLFSNDVFKTCLTSQVSKMQQQAARSAKRTKTRRRTRSSGNKRKTGKNGAIIMRRAAGPLGGPMCILQCVFEKEGLLNKDKSLNLEAMVKLFSAASDDNWVDLVKNVTGNCYNELQSSNYSALPNVTGGAPSCKANSAMVLSCIRRQLTLRCPENMLNKNDKSCPAKIEGLKKCDPFAIPTPAELIDGKVVASINEAVEKKKRQKGNKY
ncbi:Hypothetical predicted protein [Cloeon dipterum]|uniref:Uncharacterized protein n=1 Tax=Cloeon dipterum TaxID=197152 RepID=A0A8S1CPW3_9INSE|nr:Hypothetical predicted protein [Cloeon dipterum]